VTTPPPREYIPLAVQRRNLLFVILDGIAIGLMSAAGSFVSVLVIHLGASPVWVSLLSSLPNAVGLGMTLPWSRFAERQGRPQMLYAWSRLAVHVVYPMVALVPFFLSGTTAAQVIVVVWSLSAFPSSLSNLMFTIVMGHAASPERRAFQMSRRWMFMGLANMVSLPLASLLIGHTPFPHGYQLLYAGNFAIALFAFYCARHIQVEQRPRQAAANARAPNHRIRQGIVELVSEKPFMTFLGGKAVYNLGLSMVTALIPIFWLKHLHVSDSWVGYFNTAAATATLVSYIPWVRLNRKYGTRPVLILSAAGSALYPALLALTHSPVAVLPVVAFNGLVAGGLNLALFDGLLEVCPPSREERFIAINLTAMQLVGVAGPPIGAALLSILDIRWAMAIASGVALAGAAIFAIARSERQTSLPKAGSAQRQAAES
jgi:MFS family permease